MADGMVTMIKDGQAADVPVAQMSVAISKGAKLAYSMKGKDGTEAWVPSDQLDAAMKKGAVISRQPMDQSQPTQFEQKQQAAAQRYGQNFKYMTDILPAAGGAAGALLGAPLGGVGGVAGGALGAAGGQQAKLLLDRLALGNQEPSPISKQGLTQTAVAGGLAGAAEVPGAIMNTAGSMILKRIAQSQSPKQVGNAIQGLVQADASGASAQGLLRDVTNAAKAEGSTLRSSLANSNATVDLNSVISNARTAAATQDQQLTGVLRKFDRSISAAKINAGIDQTTTHVTPQQLFDFQQQLGEAFKGNPGALTAVNKNLQKVLYRDTGQAIRGAVPEAAQSLNSLTNYHAAIDAINNYSPGRAASLAVSARLNPRATAAASPIAAALLARGSETATQTIKDASGKAFGQ